MLTVEELKNCLLKMGSTSGVDEYLELVVVDKSVVVGVSKFELEDFKTDFIEFLEKKCVQ